MSLFVTATGTEVGKTVVSAALLSRYADEHPLYWKPVASGAVEGRDLENVARWVPSVGAYEETYLFEPPVSPHLAARWAGVEIERDHLLESFRGLERNALGAALVVEGIGGALVPFDEKGYLVADLIADLELPTVVVASSLLGTINHTLMTLECLRSRNVEVVGVVLNGPANAENRQAIEVFGKVRVVGEMPPVDPLEPVGLARAAEGLDPDGVLRPYLARRR